MDSPASTPSASVVLALITLLQSAVWPILFGWLFFPLRKQVHGYIQLLLRIFETRAFSLKAGGLEVSSQELLKPVEDAPKIPERQLLPSNVLEFPAKETERE